MLDDTETSSTEVTLLGFHSAGWTEYMQHCAEELHRKIYSTTYPIFDAHTSLYSRAHDETVLEAKSVYKSKSPKSVVSAMKHLHSKLLKIEEPRTREAILDYLLSSVLGLSEEEKITIITQIENTANPNQTMLQYLIEETKIWDPSDEETDLTGYAFARALAMNHALRHLFFGEDEKLSKEVIEWSGYVNLDSKPIELQSALAASKRMVVDTLQENLYRLQRGEPLLSIHVVTSAEDSDKNPLFTPDWNLAINKIGFVLTNAEIRMIYKLMHEIPDPLIHQVMMQTVVFIKNCDGDFKTTAAPWENNEANWATRTRSKEKPPHREREHHVIQPWVRELISLSQETSQLLSNRHSHSLQARGSLPEEEAMSKLDATDADESLKAPRTCSVDTKSSPPSTEQIKAKLIKFKSGGEPASSSFNPNTQGH